MIILSFHIGHNFSICLLNDGKIEKYFVLERFTKIKYDNAESPDSENVLVELIHDICKKSNIDIVCISNFNTDDTLTGEIYDYCKSHHPNVKLVIQSNHHLNHASHAFVNSGFDESLVVVVDGSGSTIKDNLVEVESVFYSNKDKTTLLYKNTVEQFDPSDLPWGEYIFSVGWLYDMTAVLIGNTPDDCGKAMGLSSYGKPNDSFKNLFDNFFENSSQEIKKFLKEPTKNITQLHADFCYEVQHQTQERVGDLIENWVEKTGIKKVCITGGYGLNIIANYYYKKRFPNVEFYFEPLCNDNGTSIGAAINSYIEVTKKFPSKSEDTFFQGFHYDVFPYQGTFASPGVVANLLLNNKSVAVYSGFSESGQRALGNRSILFNALNPNAKDIINEIKRREWYRPFAAVVLEEDAHLYFEDVCSNANMTLCFPVKSDLIPGVTHIDGTCRVQTVTSGHLYDILKEFKQLIGHGILLNTSFNLSGEPLVETPADALNVLNNSSLDYVWFEETKQLIS